MLATLGTSILTLVVQSKSVSAHDEINSGLPFVSINDNRRAAGTITPGSLVLNLRAGAGRLRPEGDQGTAVAVEAFGEESGGLQVPAPLIRVTQGTEVVASVRNDLDATLRVHGLCAHDGSAGEAIEVAPQSRQEIRFTAARAGTYQYWGTTTGMPLPFRATGDTQLSGAFIVDPPGASRDADRVLVITDWTSITREQLREVEHADDPAATFLAIDPRRTFLINGLSWPSTERLTYRLNEQVRWRVVNLSSQWHPMHLHGFYFDVEALGDGVRDTTLSAAEQPRVVTQLLKPGGTMAMTWRAERPGNWLFHCHIADHISPSRRLTEASGPDGPHHGMHNTLSGMAGMVLGVTIVGEDEATGEARNEASNPPRKFTLVMRARKSVSGPDPAYGFAMSSDGQIPPDEETISAPGPTLTLRRGEPVEITLVNQLPEATAIHWHGMELESYYDGVHGWSGAGTRLAPLIEPGQTFTVRVTPPRAGTFIYHTHLHDDRQLTSGMYGALLVLEPGETFDPALDHMIVLARFGPGTAAPAVLNGGREPQFVWKAGARHRIRFVNITPGDIFVTSLTTADAPVTWRPITKDGGPIPDSKAAPCPATQTIAVGETYDFEYQTPPGRQTLWMNVRTPAGRWQVQGRVIVK